MSRIALSGNSLGTGTFTIASPNSNTDRILSLPDAAGTIQLSGNPISGTTGTFTGLVNISAAGAGQIQFPATQNPSSNANTLDDYEEGTWTPSLINGFSSAPTSYPSRTASYVKIGRLVYFQLDMDADGATPNATPVQIGGLPFTSGGPEGFGGANRSYQIQFDQNALTSYHITNGQNFIILYDVHGNAVLGTSSGININNRIILFGCYRSDN